MILGMPQIVNIVSPTNRRIEIVKFLFNQKRLYRKEE